jgi:2-dehydropantoate 2-reductase
MMEVINAANALGITGLDESFAQKMMETTDAMVPYSPSMRLDYDFGRPMEIEYIYTRPIAEARHVGAAMPRLEMLERELRFLERN